jgi:uncharacterized RmlC-like cupin family protein
LITERILESNMSETGADWTEDVDGGNGISTIRGSGIFRGWNNIRYKAGLSEKNVGSKKLSMNLATVPGGGVAYAHIHVDFEVMLYILEGNVRHIYGENLEHTLSNGPGDFIFIEPGVPHEVFNLSETDPVVVVVARSDATEWENIIDFPSAQRDVDGVPPKD